MGRYLFFIVISTVVTVLLYFLIAVRLAPAALPAEYWVRQILVIKRNIIETHRGQQKFLVVGGSNVLFGVDAGQLAEELKVPAINLGLHAGLPLEKILSLARTGAEPGDTVVLALEPEYYGPEEQSAWQVRNLIAWEPEVWKALPLGSRLKGLSRLEPSVIFQMAAARFNAAYRPESLHDRLVPLDDAATLAAFSHVSRPTSFAYSADNLDKLGDIQGIRGGNYEGPAAGADTWTVVSPQTLAIMAVFISEMRQRHVAVYFANTPWVDTGSLDPDKVRRASQALAEQLAPLASFLDERSDLVFPRDRFFNTAYHLNVEGRKERTHLLAEALKRVNTVPVGSKASH